jgi:hypothetical protein
VSLDNAQHLTAPPLARRIPSALECLGSPGLASSIKISVLPAAAATRAGLGRWEGQFQRSVHGEKGTADADAGDFVASPDTYLDLGDLGRPAESG